MLDTTLSENAGMNEQKPKKAGSKLTSLILIAMLVGIFVGWFFNVNLPAEQAKSYADTLI